MGDLRVRAGNAVEGSDPVTFVVFGTAPVDLAASLVAPRMPWRLRCQSPSRRFANGITGSPVGSAARVVYETPAANARSICSSASLKSSVGRSGPATRRGLTVSSATSRPCEASQPRSASCSTGAHGAEPLSGQPDVEHALIRHPVRADAPCDLRARRALTVECQGRTRDQQLVQCCIAQRAVGQRAGDAACRGPRYEVYAGSGLGNSGSPTDAATRLKARYREQAGDGRRHVRILDRSRTPTVGLSFGVRDPLSHRLVRRPAVQLQSPNLDLHRQ